MASDTMRRRTSAGPVLQSEVTDAIQTAFFEELAEVGYGRLSIDAVAKRAGVGKAAIYRRWRSKLDMTVALTSEVAVAAIDVPDTGSLRGDIRQYLDNACEAIAHPLARHIIPDLLAEATRNPALADALVPTLRTPRRAKAAVLFQRAVKRGELAADSDLEMCMDFLAGPLYWRLAVVHTQTGEDYLDRLTDRILAALTMTA
ncbi:TetR/AcrR family transcriptional regulator [Mycobacterium sp.]|jgi:AcrR family transcriptional regulator|uniref:TetR/AcrR family transcriptional regulator n=1 Tax=Mycobacterium sp. TaxID=1785 RepID=UPI002C99C4E1|nr:TetR/AcrR family transcriptional regulator [Mycobacterium sp.]HTH89872.1 TetR/AcrR family transcriptional regulator [Mycobacterium sp.]